MNELLKLNMAAKIIPRRKRLYLVKKFRMLVIWTPSISLTYNLAEDIHSIVVFCSDTGKQKQLQVICGINDSNCPENFEFISPSI